MTTKKPSKLMLFLSYLLTPVLVVYIAILALQRRVSRARHNRWMKKTIGRPMTHWETILWNVRNPLTFK